MNRRHALPALVLSLSLALPARSATAVERRPIDLVICLDTSGSMGDLLDSVRARLWDIVNHLSRLEPTPELRIGLLTFGSPGPATEESGWVVLRSDLTTDLDSVYAELMAVETDGGDELVGRVLHEAIFRASWSFNPDALRLIFVAGNESADQGVAEYDFRAAAHRARVDDIIINAIYAGNHEQGNVELWPEVAREGQGSYSSIDVAASMLQVATPQDEKLRDLNTRLNTTYVPYGSLGEKGVSNQRAQDESSLRLGVESCSARIVSKGTALYTNGGWDLVDRALEAGFEWSAIPRDDLPESLRDLPDPEKTRYIETRRRQRESIQEEIQSLNEARESYLEAEKKKLLAGASSLDDVMKAALLAQATAKGFRCPGC